MIHTILPIYLALTAPIFAIPVFIGTGTGGKSTSKGIYSADFDSQTGKLAEPVLAGEYRNPGFLAIHPAKPILYASGKPSQPFSDGMDSVAAFQIQDDGELKLLREVSGGGKDACHVAVDATATTIAVANYGNGTFSTINLDEAGLPGGIVSHIASQGTGPNPERQKGPHAHGVYFDPENARLLVPDLGIDQVLVYPFIVATSKLGDALPPITTAPGAGPRHLAFSPDGKHVYVINELDNTIYGGTWKDGKFTAIESVPTLPADFSGSNTTAEIEFHPNGKFVYGSNRGHGSIVVYARDAVTGKLTFLQHAPCGGRIPRHFKIDPTGKWLLCAHQDSNTISVLALDPETGKLGDPRNTVSVPSPICVLFAEPR